MSETAWVSPDQIRAQFAKAMSQMYRQEVPAYGQLVSIVAEVNQQVQATSSSGLAALPEADIERLSAERHGAIRLGTAQELAMMRRAFAVMGMFPVDYYDLSVASIPVHSTAFRPLEAESLARNPFRVFTSLLQLSLIPDPELRETARELLASRQIFTPPALRLIEQAEQAGGLSADQANEFVRELLETFRWHHDALVSAETYQRLHQAHRLIADVVSFKGPHINHLTPRTLDIDTCQQAMQAQGLPAKAVIEGPPARRCPILLRQTSFKALQEPVRFESSDGTHTARFGEIEQRGVALTPRGRALYDQLLNQARAEAAPQADGANAQDYQQALHDAFQAFPDDWQALHDQQLAYVRYTLGSRGFERVKLDHSLDHLLEQSPEAVQALSQLITDGVLRIEPITYEDFLPVSAAGIFQSNLGDQAQSTASQGEANQAAFEQALGCPVADSFSHYHAIQQASLAQCLSASTP